MIETRRSRSDRHFCEACVLTPTYQPCPATGLDFWGRRPTLAGVTLRRARWWLADRLRTLARMIE